ALCLRIPLIQQGLPLLVHEDEPIYLRHAMSFGYGDWNPGYFKKPSFFLYFYSAFYHLVYLYTPFLTWGEFDRAFWQDPTLVVSVGRMITTLFAAGSVFLLYRIGARLFSTAVGLIAALLLAVDPVHVQFSPIVI